MVNKKLTLEDEENIYMEHLRGMKLTKIAEKYPVVISTIQRVVKKQDKTHGCLKNVIINTIFKHLNYANEPIDTCVNLLSNNNLPVLFEKQKEYLLTSVDNLMTNLEILKTKIKDLQL
nr:MAG: hypothetical protein DiTV3a_F4ORF1 [Diabrotica toursvirus 3a]